MRIVAGWIDGLRALLKYELKDCLVPLLSDQWSENMRRGGNCLQVLLPTVKCGLDGLNQLNR
jgi:hypothetical protein